MTTQIDWQQELDASFGSGDDVPVGHYVAAGQRAVRRRRRTGVVAGLAAAAVVAGVAWGVAPERGASGGEAPIATDPDRTSAMSDGAEPWGEDEPPARFDGAGVEVREGAVVHERRDDLYPGKGTESAALDVSFDGERWWLAMEWDGGASATTTVSRPEDGLLATFDAFVRDRVRGGGMITRPSSENDDFFGGLVQWDGGDVVAGRGVEIVRTVEDPGPPADDSLGLVLAKNGETTWMLITLDPPDSSGASWSEESDSGWATFDQWLADQVAIAENTEGPVLVRLGADGTVVTAAPGVEVLEQQADPDLMAYGTDAEGAASAVALAEWQGARWFVLLVRIDGRDSVTTVAADKADGASTLDEFVAFMADRADEGGMR